MASGGDVVPGPPRAQASARGGLPLDIVVEIAVRSDPATLLRCAATCADVRRRVRAAADDDGGRAFRLRLRHADRFVPSLLRGHLEARLLGWYGNAAELYLVDIAAAAADTTAAARLLTAADGFPTPAYTTLLPRHMPVASRDGLLLVHTTKGRPPKSELRVCDPATGRSQTLPPEPAFPAGSDPTSSPSRTARKRWEPYVLLVGDGDGAAGGIRPFQVLKANLVMSKHHCYLQTQTFSSETGAWGRYTEIRAPHLHGSYLVRGSGKPLVAGGAAHWLCITESGSYVVKLSISTAALQVTVTALPASFPRSDYSIGIDYLLATTAPAAGGGELMVLVADSKKISAWVQTKPATAATATKWEQRPQLVMGYEAMMRFANMQWVGTFLVKLHWFAERSGLVLFSSDGYGEFWLDLGSMEVVRCLPESGSLGRNRTECLPYEMDLSSWAPTFTGSTI